jgi:hypothetical protein
MTRAPAEASIRLLAQPALEAWNDRVIVRDDLLPGGTKMRAILPMMVCSPAAEFVYASPAQGYAQVALAHCAALTGKRATIFTAKRNTPSALTLAAKEAGAKIVMVPHGYLSNVQSKATRYALETGAELMPFGIDSEAAIAGIAGAAAAIGLRPPEVWSVAGSGVLTRALQNAWPEAKVYAVIVGKLDAPTGRAERIVHPLPFAVEADVRPHFPSAPHYDAKAWESFRDHACRGALFWNVAA